MSRLRLTDELQSRVAEVFKNPRQLVFSGEGFSRTELRFLERRGIIEKTRMVRRSRFTDGGSAVMYAYRLVRGLV